MKFSTFGFLALAHTGLTSAIPASATVEARGTYPTPQPIQPGMVDNCNLFYFVKSGDTCQAIAKIYGINLLSLRTWNPAIQTDCTALIPETYICTGIEGKDPVEKTKCDTDATSKPWGDELPAALEAAATWCKDKSGAPGKYTKDEKRVTCINSPSGLNRFYFRFINEWGYPLGVVPHVCEEVFDLAINGCERGGSGRRGGWEAIASISEGQC